MRIPMDRKSRLILIAGMASLASFASPRKASAEIKHMGYAEVDKWRACAESVFKKHVLLFYVEDIAEQAVLCPAISEEAFVTSLRASDYVVLMDQDWVFLVPRRTLSIVISPGRVQSPWKAIRVEVDLEDKSSKADKRLNIDQLAQLRNALLQDARLIPVYTSEKTEFQETAVVSLRYEVYVSQLTHEGPTSVVVVLREADQGSDLGRVIYGELQGEKVSLKWDSPVVQVRNLEVNFQDVNGDGTDEIVLTGKYHLGVTISELTTLSILDHEGNEITRQDCRFVPLFDAYHERACPIAGEVVDVDCGRGVCTIFSRFSQPEVDRQFGGRFVLTKGQYTRVADARSRRPAIGTEVGDAAARNAEGMKLMKEKNYKGAAPIFAEAAKLDPGNAMLANNTGFAYYKMERYVESVPWLQKAIGIDPKRAVAYLNLGDAYAKLNRTAEARQAYTKYLELAPNSKSASDVKKKLAALPPSP